MSILRAIFPQKEPRHIMSEYNIPSRIDWNIQLNSKGLVATSKDLPGLVTNADNPEELLEMMNDAVLEYFDVPKLESDYVFDTLNLAGQGNITLKQAQKKKQLA